MKKISLKMLDQIHNIAYFLIFSFRGVLIFPQKSSITIMQQPASTVQQQGGGTGTGGRTKLPAKESQQFYKIFSCSPFLQVSHRISDKYDFKADPDLGFCLHTRKGNFTFLLSFFKLCLFHLKISKVFT
jgi:hypothetical protein